jgi:hypothetical protein
VFTIVRIFTWPNNRLVGQMSAQSFAPESPATRKLPQNGGNVRVGDNPPGTRTAPSKMRLNERLGLSPVDQWL